MPLSISHESVISIENMPIQWISLIDLYSTALPQFPLKYVHVMHDGERIFGFPRSYELLKQADGSFDWRFHFLSNEPLDAQRMRIVRKELMQRLGAENAVERADVEACCSSGESRKGFLLKVWDSFIGPTYGGRLPFGRFYDEMYSFPRCAAAFIPQSGGKSEWQMLYDFIRHYGEKVEIAKPWNFLEFFLLPTYDELLRRSLRDFPTYRKLQSAIDKFGVRYFTGEFTTGGTTLRTVKSKITDMDGYDLGSPNGMRELTSFLVRKGTFSIDEKRELDFLIDAFNRLATRAFGFIGAVYNAKPENDFRKWDGTRFKQFYHDIGEERTVGIYPKIWGMILQQGFGNPEVIPIDEWIDSFYRIPLKIDSKEHFLGTFSNIGKLERMLWITVQARKTNMYTIFDWLWCLKFGTGKTTVDITGVDVRRLRDANPLSCLNCPLKKQCEAFSEISDADTYVMAVSGKIPRESRLRTPTKSQFAVLTVDNIPKYVFLRVDGGYELIDGFTGLEIHESETSFKDEKTTVSEFMRDLSS